MEDSILEIVVYLTTGLVVGFIICFSALKQRYLSKYEKSIDELKTKYAGDVSQSISLSKSLMEVEGQNELLASEIAVKNSTIEALAGEVKATAESFARLESDLNVSQALVEEKEEELKNYQQRLRINRNDLEYTATLETRLATLTNDYELKLSHKETKIQNLQHRLIDLEKAKNLLIEEMNAQRRSATLEDGAAFEQQTTEIQELQHLVHDLIEHTPIDETGTPYLLEGALTEAQAAHQRALQEKDVEIAQLLEYIAGVENLNAIAAKRDTKLREVETRLDELQTSHQRLASEKAAQEAELADKDAQLAELLERVSFIGTLRKQYAEKETELQAIEEKFQTAINHKNLEIHFLQERVDNLEKLHTTSIEDLKTGYASELAEKDFAIRELQSQASGVNETSSLAASPGKLDLVAQYQSALEAKDEEIADLQERIQALETLFAAHSEEVDLKLKEKEAEILKSREDAEALEVFVAAHSQEIDARLKEKEAEILELQECITDLESANFISQELKKMAAQYQATIQTKNSEIVRLQMRINQLEPFSALVAQRDARIRELDSRFQIAIGARDAEITRLQNRLKELNSTAKMAY